MVIFQKFQPQRKIEEEKKQEEHTSPNELLSVEEYWKRRTKVYLKAVEVYLVPKV